MSDYDGEVMGCWVCTGPLVYLGTLGNVAHYQCQNCGMAAHRLEHWSDYYCQDVTPEIVTTPEDPG